MRLHRFYISEAIGLQKDITITSAALVHQIRNVFRLKVGDSIILFDGSGFDYECVIDNLGKKSTIVSNHKSDKGSDLSSLSVRVATTKRSAFSPGREVVLCAALVKKDTFEWIVEKATELGVTKIIPIQAERSEKKNMNEERLNKIAVEASEQSGRGTIPAIEKIMTLNETIAHLNDQKITSDSMICFHTEGEVFDRADFDNKVSLAVFIGPEGGWSPDEVEVFHKNNIPTISLGSQILRAETAVVAALSVVLLGN